MLQLVMDAREMLLVHGTEAFEDGCHEETAEDDYCEETVEDDWDVEIDCWTIVDIQPQGS